MSNCQKCNINYYLQKNWNYFVIIKIIFILCNYSIVKSVKTMYGTGYKKLQQLSMLLVSYDEFHKLNEHGTTLGNRCIHLNNQIFVLASDIGSCNGIINILTEHGISASSINCTKEFVDTTQEYKNILAIFRNKYE